MRSAGLLLSSMVACAAAPPVIYTDPTGVVLRGDDAAQAHWTPTVERLVEERLAECFSWWSGRLPEHRDLLVAAWRNLQVHIRWFPTKLNAIERGFPNGGELPTPQLIRVAWLGDFEPRWLGAVICHEAGHLVLAFPEFDHDLMNALGYFY